MLFCLAQGFKSVYKPQRNGAVQFAELLDAVAAVDPEMRIRFTSPHPKDFSDDVLKVNLLMAKSVLPLLSSHTPLVSDGVCWSACSCMHLSMCLTALMHVHLHAVHVCPMCAVTFCAHIRCHLCCGFAAGHCESPQCLQASTHARSKRQQQHAGAHAPWLHSPSLR